MTNNEARDDEREAAFQQLRDLDEQFDPAEDQRIEAWNLVAGHPIFAECFAAESSLLDAMMARLDDLATRKHPEPETPTVEQWAATLRAERERQIAKGYDGEHDQGHGVKHLVNWAIDYGRRGATVKSHALMLAVLDLLAKHPGDEVTERDIVALAIAKAADGDYWADEIREWEKSEEWEREAHPDNYPIGAYEDRDWYREQAEAAITALRVPVGDPVSGEGEQ